MTSNFACECGCICGVCPKTEDECDCECHEADMLSCTEIVACVKNLDPTVDVASFAGMNRNMLFKWITQTWLSRHNEDDLSDFFRILGRRRKCKPVANYLFVPSNIGVLLSGIKQKVTIDRRQTDIPLCYEGCCKHHEIVGYHNDTTQNEVVKPRGRVPACVWKKKMRPVQRDTLSRSSVIRKADVRRT